MTDQPHGLTNDRDADFSLHLIREVDGVQPGDAGAPEGPDRRR
jgi:hypothetical protein